MQKGTLYNQKNAKQLLVYSLFLGIGISIGIFINIVKKDKFSQILDIINKDYVDSAKAANLEEETIDYLLAQLDPHSSYIPTELAEQNARQIDGKYEGLGIEYMAFKDTLFVYNVFAGGPAAKAGILPGDRLLQANGIKLTDSLTRSEISEAMKGETETNAELLVYRKQTNKRINFSIPRSTIMVNSSEIYYMVNATTGYIQIKMFSGSTHKQFVKALKELKIQGLKDLILDLRNNGGGLLFEATKIANEFLTENAIISYTEGLHRKRQNYKADGKGNFINGKLILLINHNTASASEILAGALQDNDRAVILGNRSFGKGLVQEPFQLIDGSTLRLTISRYFTPSGRSIQKPYTTNTTAYHNEIYTRNNSDDTLNLALDSTIVKKYFTKNGRLLTSGGGIRPDIVLRDTIADSTEIERLTPGLFYSHIFDVYLLDNMQNEVAFAQKQYKTLGLFETNYTIPEKHIKQLIILAKTIPYLNRLTYSKKTGDIIQKHLKAAIAMRLFGEKGKSQTINSAEGVFSKSLQVLKNFNAILNIGQQKAHSFDY
ncbi:MAG: S41 family peptidase [Bacteroidetes bacterium]|nr:S41 family peptidase [Bacteroidota bacterium]